ncbi:hypothetical protein LMG26857_03559 [Achromobacter anxifer]|uniref:hypothetical protein n=1 Tax=Achromobacter anxifer TaxID=1287737 RepID=UPI00155B80C5|nr:hypothetical protein [Achromobacter anxifer]CAB5514500.1 hypothetical protein LMG26857_03559 [Achromobacter anxifer]
MFTLVSVTKILDTIAGCARRSLAPSGIARKAAQPGITAAQVTQVLQVLEALPYVRVDRTPSGRISGYGAKYGASGSCSRLFSRSSPGETRYFYETRLVECVPERDYADDVKARRAMEAYAKEHDLPILDNLGWTTPSIAPYVLRALLTQTS